MRSHPAGRTGAVVAAGTCLTLLLTACGSGYGDSEGDGTITVLFGSSGEAETAAVKAAVAAWSEESGTPAEAVPAQDLVQQLRQGFAGGDPADVFYVSPDLFQQYAEGGSLYPYGDQIEDTGDFYPALRDSYTYEDELYCVPKDYNTHALVINTAMWEEAGLGEDDVPTTWEELAETAEKLTEGDRVGFALNGDYNSVGTFMQQAGGWFVNDDNTEATGDSPENLAALEYLRTGLDEGYFSFVKDIDAQSGSEALGRGRAAMVMDGGWVTGAFDNDYPDLDWRAVELPEGPGGRATTVFSNCWGIAEASGDHEAAVDLVRQLTSAEQQQTFAEDFGAVPPRESLADWTAETFPEHAAFAAGVDYARGQVPVPGFMSVLNEFTTGLQGVAAGSTEPAEVLDRLQRDGEEALGG
ncbi:ABC transporter substrate-binding protein [Marinactinospora rubrisoli]|uniref:ABC transporter substrate-binding protein n=1 Tax=Marinactinospora rubrisoli TaxID=2715399 RepID=A0ABW2KMP8_9ACTN